MAEDLSASPNNYIVRRSCCVSAFEVKPARFGIATQVTTAAGQAMGKELNKNGSCGFSSHAHDPNIRETKEGLRS